MSSYDAVFFDMGYTLVYFEPPQPVIFQAALRAVGAEKTVEEVKSAVDAVYADVTRDADTATFPATPEYDREMQRSYEQGILVRLGVEPAPATLHAFSAALEASFLRPGLLRLYPEATEVLSALQADGYRLAIVSNWGWNLRQRVGQVALDRFFEVIWASAYAGYNKPHSGIFQQALAQMPPPALPASRVLYVGDSYRHDVVGARGAGMAAALLDRAGAADSPDCPVIRDLRGVFDLL